MVCLMVWKRTWDHLIAPATGGSSFVSGGLSFCVSKISFILSTFNRNKRCIIKIFSAVALTAIQFFKGGLGFIKLICH